MMVIGIILIPVGVFANEDEKDDEGEKLEPGQLLINDRTIQDGHIVDHDQFRPIGFEIAPFLFLEDMMEAQEQRVARNTEFLITIRENLFLKELSNTGFDTREIIDRLFIDAELSEHGHIHASMETQVHHFHIPAWITVIAVVAVTCFLAYVAIIIGNVTQKLRKGVRLSG